MMQSISDSVEHAVDVMKIDEQGIIDTDRFIGNVIEEIEKARGLGYENRANEESWAVLSGQITDHIQALKMAQQEIKAQRSAVTNGVAKTEQPEPREHELPVLAQ